MYVASRLHKFEHEVLELSGDEYARWLAFFRYMNEEKAKAIKAARRGRGS